jgi:hypothetical protein
MSINVVQALRGKPSYEAARLIGNAPQFIKDNNFVNLLNQFDLNNKKNDKLLINQFNMFASIPGLKEQVTAWLSS